MRFHLLGLAHTRTTGDYLSCAFTQKIWKLARMLTDKGHEVIHYGAEGADVPGEKVVTIPEELFQKFYGDYDWHKENFKYDDTNEVMKIHTANAIREINARKQPDDFILSTFGIGQKPIFDGVDLRLKVESGVGYSGVFSEFHVFESQTWMHYIWGKYGTPNDDGLWYDVVIPNSYDPDDFPLGLSHEDYFLYMGRIVNRKGIHIAARVCEKLGKLLVVAGQGRLEDADLQDFKCIRFIGSVQDQKLKAQLLGCATAVFCPTIYIEPFGGVAVEAMMCGTPVITSNYGAFTETVQHGVTGYRCQDFADFLWAAKNVQYLDHKRIRKYAVARYSNDRCAKMYDEYFRRLHTIVAGKGWYEDRPGQSNLKWLE